MNALCKTSYFNIHPKNRNDTYDQLTAGIGLVTTCRINKTSIVNFLFFEAEYLNRELGQTWQELFILAHEFGGQTASRLGSPAPDTSCLKPDPETDKPT